eukprot:1180656-Prorocentrum_minimum.AAC.1
MKALDLRWARPMAHADAEMVPREQRARSSRWNVSISRLAAEGCCSSRCARRLSLRSSNAPPSRACKTNTYILLDRKKSSTTKI